MLKLLFCDRVYFDLKLSCFSKSEGIGALVYSSAQKEKAHEKGRIEMRLVGHLLANCLLCLFGERGLLGKMAALEHRACSPKPMTSTSCTH